jgi:hypothetical protein
LSYWSSNYFCNRWWALGYFSVDNLIEVVEQLGGGGAGFVRPPDQKLIYLKGRVHEAEGEELELIHFILKFLEENGDSLTDRYPISILEDDQEVFAIIKKFLDEQLE